MCILVVVMSDAPMYQIVESIAVVNRIGFCQIKEVPNSSIVDGVYYSSSKWLNQCFVCISLAKDIKTASPFGPCIVIGIGLVDIVSRL